MQIAHYIGFSKFILIEVDHNFIASKNPNEKLIMHKEDMNYFYPRYFGSKEWHLPDLEASELAYYHARFHFNRNRSQIYAVTVNGKLNIFPKTSFEEALELCGR